MIARTSPAINGERSNIGAGTSNRGIKPKYLFNHLAQYSADDIKIKNPQKPYSKEGKAAIKSIKEIKKVLIFPLA